MRSTNDHLVVIVGCGRLGALVASRLSRRGLEVVVIDRSEAAFDTLAPAFSGFRVVGDATELAVLRAARVGEACAVLATTSDDNTNMMVAQVARQVLGVPQAVARVFDPAREAIYRGLEIEAVCPTTLAADAAIARLSSALSAAQGRRP